MFYSENSHYPIGLDISDLSVKAIQLNKKREKIVIQAISSRAVPEGIIVNGEIKNKEKAIEIIKDLISKPDYGHIGSQEVVACLPDARTFIKLVTVEKSLNSLEDIIEHEMEKHIPFPINEIYHDWQIIESNTNNYEVLIGAAPKLIVDQYTSLLNEAGLSTIALEIEPISICRCLLREESPNSKVKSKENYCIFDLGATHSSMIFYSRNTILFTMSVPITGDEITKKIAAGLNLPYAKAEKAKQLCGLDSESGQGIIKNLLTDMTNELTEKIKELVDFYKINFPENGPINQIILSGGGANIKKLATTISKSTSIPAIIGDAFAQLTLKDDDKNKLFSELAKNLKDDAGNVPQVKRLDPAYTTAIGLALRGVFIDEI